jgi:hypothetical protein
MGFAVKQSHQQKDENPKIGRWRFAIGVVQNNLFLHFFLLLKTVHVIAT